MGSDLRSIKSHRSIARLVEEMPDGQQIASETTTATRFMPSCIANKHLHSPCLHSSVGAVYVLDIAHIHWEMSGTAVYDQKWDVSLLLKHSSIQTQKHFK